MPTPCVTCAHPEREAIDRALVLGRESMRALAKRYGMDRHSLARHRAAHMSPALAKVAAERQEAGPRSALERLEELLTEARAVLATAKAGGQGQLSLAAIRELRGLVELTARITGELDERPQVNVLNLSTNPEWTAVREALIRALAPYPEARAAVGAALASLPAPAGDAA